MPNNFGMIAYTPQLGGRKTKLKNDVIVKNNRKA